MKRFFFQILTLTLALALCFVMSGCNKAQPTHCVLNGKRIEFVSRSEKKSWKKPLAKLLANVRIAYGEGGEYIGESAAVDENAPSIPDFSSCCLFDVTMDGVPELLIIPYGSTGSSGAVLFEAYDIVSGEQVGSVSCDFSGALCMYYNTDEEEIQTFSRYRFRCGWSGRSRYIEKVEYDAQREEYTTVPYLRTDHLIESEKIPTPDGEIATYEEIYTDTEYFLYGKKVTLDDYDAEYDEFTRTCVQIAETEIILFSRYELEKTEKDHREIGKLLAEQLLSSDQQFVRFD